MNPEEKRQMECPVRRGSGTCGLIDTALGFKVQLPLNHCDQCWAKGGMRGFKAARHRAKLIGDIREKMLKIPASQLPVNVRDALGYEITDNDRRIIKEKQEASERWNAVRDTWLQKVTSFGTSVGSRLLEGDADSTDYIQRHISCFGQHPDGTHFDEPCPSLRKTEKGDYFCGDCGCGDSTLAKLNGPDSKLQKYPYLKCPRRKEGFSNYAKPATLTINGQPSGL